MRVAGLVVTAGLVVLGCAGERARVPSSATTPVPSVPSGAAVPRVETGTVLVVTMDRGIDTSSAVPGQTFRATVRDPVYTGGEAVIERGAMAEGHVVAVEQGAQPRVWVAFDRVESIRGVVPLDARVVEADAYGYVLPDPQPRGRGIGGGPQPEILVPMGGELRLVLEEPIEIPPR